MLKSNKLLLSAVAVLVLFFSLLIAVPAVFAEEAPAPDTTTEETQNEPATGTETPETLEEDEKQKLFVELEALVLERIKSEVGIDYSNQYTKSKIVWEQIKAEASTELPPLLTDEQIALWNDFVVYFNEKVELFTNGSETENLVDRFIANLKDRYGADYEYYLTAILEQWGSIEAYLLAQTDNLPDEFQTGYEDFIGWLSEYAPVWAPCLAVALIIIGFIVGKKALNKMLARLVDARVSPIQSELNKQSEAQAAQLKATRALLGTNEKFAEERKAAETAEKKLLE